MGAARVWLGENPILRTNEYEFYYRIVWLDGIFI